MVEQARKLSLWRRFKLRLRSALDGDPVWFLGRARGVIHIGANEGQERDLYLSYGLPVIWVEPIPEVFNKLQQNIKDCPRQRALQYLVTDKDGGDYEFHIASNQGASSSIFDLKLHKDLWPDVAYERSIRLKAVTLQTLLKKEGIDLREYDALVIDTQGSELLVLRGAGDLLKSFRFIKVELPDFESYNGCCQLKDVESYLEDYGFRAQTRRKFAEKQGIGSYYNVVFMKKN